MNQSLIKFLNILFLCISLIAVASCKVPLSIDDGSELQESSDIALKEKLIQMGYKADMIEDYGSFFLVEGDIRIEKNEIMAAPAISRQARFQNIVGDYRNLKVRIDRSIPTRGRENWRLEIVRAISDWNNISSCGLHLTLTRSTTQDILIRSDRGRYPSSVIIVGSAPVSGKAGRTIEINIDSPYNFSSPQKRFMVVHSIGHNLGFRHTNWKSNGEWNAIFIPGTVETDANSVMNGGVLKAWSGFSYYDRIAARRLFPTAYPLVPPYGPGYWNNSSTTKKNNNCYNYACNIKTNNFAQPGYASGYSLSSLFTASDVLSYAKKDGLQFAGTSLPSFVPAGKALVALVYGRYVFYNRYNRKWYPDYHWYRRDSNGKWSHKPGEGSAKNTDYTGRIITDPRSADRRVSGGGRYDQFLGYFYVYSAYNQGQGREYIKGSRRTTRSIIQRNQLKVTFQIFSGRNNPSFYISDKNIIKQIQGLYNQNKNNPLKKNTTQSKIGYSGLLVENPGKIAGLPVEFVVYNGMIETPEFERNRGEPGQSLTIHLDSGRVLEDILLKLASKENIMDIGD